MSGTVGRRKRTTVQNAERLPIMSSTQFVEYQKHGFWAYDVALGVFLKHVIDAASSHDQGGSKWLADATAWWRVVACVGDYGLRIDSEWSADQLAVFAELAHRACAQIAGAEVIHAADVASWKVLNNQTIFLRGATELRTTPIVELGRAVIALVHGTLPEPPPGTCWYFGAPDGRSTIRMRSYRESLRDGTE